MSLLQKLGQPIMDRFMEAEERPKAFEELGKQIQMYMKFVEAYKMKVIPEVFNNKVFVYLLSFSQNTYFNLKRLKKDLKLLLLLLSFFNELLSFFLSQITENVLQNYLFS